MNRAAAGVVSIALIVATASPVLRKPWQDGFPLSTYAMFAFARPTNQTLEYPLGITASGDRRYLAPWSIGSGEVLQALNVVSRAKSTRTLPALCTTIASRIASLDEYRDVVSIRFVTGTHDAVDFLVRDQLGKETELVRCEVVR
ncbi:MAG: hypothetical protein JWP01_3429 [Myxococcales bacterium]|nr:hypothetical protein [Myxococcales bacterium]